MVCRGGELISLSARTHGDTNKEGRQKVAMNQNPLPVRALLAGRKKVDRFTATSAEKKRRKKEAAGTNYREIIRMIFKSSLCRDVTETRPAGKDSFFRFLDRLREEGKNGAYFSTYRSFFLSFFTRGTRFENPSSTALKIHTYTYLFTMERVSSVSACLVFRPRNELTLFAQDWGKKCRFPFQN